jgi:hypothetical protein
MIGWLSVGKSLLKSKWFWAALIVGVVGWFILSYSNIKGDLASAYANLQGLSQSLETTNKSIDKLRSEMERVDRFVVERNESREELLKQLADTKKQLEEERKNNEDLDQCWNVPHGNAFDGMRTPSEER